MKKMLFLLFMFFLANFFFACSEDSPNSPNNGNSSDSNNPSGGNIAGSYAVLPSNKDLDKVREMYNTWIQTLYITIEDDAAAGTFNINNVGEAVRGTARIKASYSGCTGGGCTVSEAIGYGMILTVLMEDWEKFDKLYAYSKAFYIQGSSLMRWDVVNFTSGKGGSATDADIDIAAALLVAYKKNAPKKQEYLDGALAIAASIYEWEIDATTKLVLPAMRSERMGDGSLYNISYMSLPALKMFAEFDKTRDWNAVLDANIAYMEKVQNAGPGLWPDWSDPSGAAINPANSSNTILTATDGSSVNSWESYYKEGPRIPWRIAWYYHWYGDSRAKNMLDKGIAFLRLKGATDYKGIKDFYKYDGTKESNGSSVMARSSLCALGMGNSANSEWLNSCNEWMINEYTVSISQYYPASLRLIYAMLFNGTF